MSKATLGAGDVQLMLDGQMVTLRPTLRAAQTISRQAGGIVAAIQAVGRFDVDVIAQVVALGLDKFKPGDLPVVAEQVYTTGLTEIVPAVTTYLTNLANGGRPAAKSEDENPPLAPKLIDLADYYDELAEIALGWLGWSEIDALASDVNAILVAHRGRAAMLNALFGGGEAAAEKMGPQTLREALGR